MNYGGPGSRPAQPKTTPMLVDRVRVLEGRCARLERLLLALDYQGGGVSAMRADLAAIKAEVAAELPAAVAASDDDTSTPHQWQATICPPAAVLAEALDAERLRKSER